MRWDKERFPTPDSHVYGENGIETMVYSMKRDSKKKWTREKNGERERFKKYNSKKGKTLNY